MDFSLEKKEIDTGLFRIEYPAHYTVLNEGGGETMGFALVPDTIGVLRLSSFRLPDEMTGNKMQDEFLGKNPAAQEMKINDHRCIFLIESKAYSGNDHLFWPEDYAPMSMYFYLLRIKNVCVFFSYRIPEFMEDNGRFDSEHPVILNIIASLRLNS